MGGFNQRFGSKNKKKSSSFEKFELSSPGKVITRQDVDNDDDFDDKISEVISSENDSQRQVNLTLISEPNISINIGQDTTSSLVRSSFIPAITSRSKDAAVNQHTTRERRGKNLAIAVAQKTIDAAGIQR